jgi:cystathionine gamma-lyase
MNENNGDAAPGASRWGLGTLAIHGGQSPDPSTGAVMPPIYATSTYAQSSPGVHQGYEYSRTQNPTRFAYERCIAALEGGSRGFAFASGMAATSTVLELLDSGSHVVAMDDVYGGSYRLFERVRRRSAGLDFSFVDLTDPAAFEAAIRPETRMVWIETPTNPMLKIVDLQAVCAIARKRGILAVVDNTFASPILQRRHRRRHRRGRRQRRTGRAARLPAELHRCSAGSVRQLPRLARPEDPAPADEGAL